MKALRPLLAGLVAVGFTVGAGHATATAAERPKAHWTAHTYRTPPPDLIDTLRYGTLVAHRGGKARYAEASMAAYTAAAKSGFPLEMDVQTLKDGTLVLMHDATVDRTTNGHGRVADMTLAQWQQLRLADGTMPPTWGMVAGAFGGKALMVVETRTRSSVNPMIRSIRSRGIQRDVLMSSFTLSDVQATARYGIPSMLLGAPITSSTGFRFLYQQGIRWWGPSTQTRGIVSAIARAKAQGVRTVPWIVNTPDIASKTFAGGAYAVITDDPWALSASKEW